MDQNRAFHLLVQQPTFVVVGVRATTELISAGPRFTAGKLKLFVGMHGDRRKRFIKLLGFHFGVRKTEQSR